MADLDFSGIFDAKSRAIEAEEKYLRDLRKQAGEDQLKATFVNKFVSEAMFDGPERKRKELIQLNLTSAELDKKLRDARIAQNEKIVNEIQANQNKIFNHKDGEEAGARELAITLFNNSDIGKLISDQDFLTHIDYLPQYEKDKLTTLREEVINDTATNILNLANETKNATFTDENGQVTKLPPLEEYLENAYKLSNDLYTNMAAGISLDADKVDPFKVGIDKITGNSIDSNLGIIRGVQQKLQNEYNAINNNIKNYANKYTNTLNTTNFTTEVNTILNLDLTSLKTTNSNISKFMSGGRTEDVGFRSAAFILEPGVIKDVNGNVSTQTTSLFGKVEGSGLFSSDVEIPKENITIKERFINENNQLDERIINNAVPEEVLQGMITPIVQVLQYEDKRNPQTFGTKGPVELTNNAYRLLAESGLIKLVDSNDASKGIRDRKSVV